jgi:hypothetical protein
VRARWDPHEHCLDADVDVIGRAEVIVAMGDTFVCPDSSTIVTASLEDAFSALLTTIRAVDIVTSIVVQTAERRSDV